MYERFTDRARKVMQLANQEAQRLNHEYIGTEHILLGLVKEGSGVAANVLKNLDIDLRKIRLEVEKLVQTGPDMVTLGKLPQTPRAKKVIEYSIEEARNLNHNYVGTEHLLLGLLREQESVAAQVLMNLGLKLEGVREEVLNLQRLNPADEFRLQAGSLPKPVKDLYEELRDLPDETLQELKAIDVQIEQLNQEKESAVAEQDFEKAAHLRDQADKLKKKWFGIVCEYRKNPDYFVCPPRKL
jgi:ATP-dependent Clp protease ATP-binding subunit ClpA